MSMDAMKQFVGEMGSTVCSFSFLFFCTFHLILLPQLNPFLLNPIRSFSFLGAFISVPFFAAMNINNSSTFLQMLTSKDAWNFTSRSRSRGIFISLFTLDLDFKAFSFHFSFSISISRHSHFTFHSRNKWKHFRFHSFSREKRVKNSNFLIMYSTKMHRFHNCDSLSFIFQQWTDCHRL